MKKKNNKVSRQVAKSKPKIKKPSKSAKRHLPNSSSLSNRKNINNTLKSPVANIKVIGVGGGGGNAVSRMSKNFLNVVDFIAINTDSQDLNTVKAGNKIYIGRNLTKGLGTGMNPELGRQAAEENRSEIAESVKDADIVFIAAGMGGGTGTGASPVIAETAKQNGALTLGFVTKPFSFEGSQRAKIAQEGLLKLKEKVDALIVVPNDRIFSVINKETPLIKAFERIDDVMEDALRGIVDLITMPGIINVDFADVKSILENAGTAIVGLGEAVGENRAQKAIEQALNSPLLEVSAEGAKGILLGISGSKDLKMSEINEIAKIVSQIADPSAKIIFGAYYDPNLKQGAIKVTVIAVGFNGSASRPSLFESFNENIFNQVDSNQQDESDKINLEDSAKDLTKDSKQEPRKEDFWDSKEIPAFLRKRKK